MLRSVMRLRVELGVLVGAAAAAVGFGVAFGSSFVAAMGSAVSVPASAHEVAVRGDQVVINPPPAPPTATYRVTFDAEWTSATHPSTLPGGAHFSAPILAVHNTPGAMFAPGQAASPGIERMAEVGSTSSLLAELRSTSGVSVATVSSGIAAPATGARSFDITVTQSASLVSLVTMIAPSPDWFAGFADRDTFVDGQWIDSVTFAASNYDAGTDSGVRFTSGNADTNPAQPISGPRDATFSAAASEAPFATVTITRTG